MAANSRPSFPFHIRASLGATEGNLVKIPGDASDSDRGFSKGFSKGLNEFSMFVDMFFGHHLSRVVGKCCETYKVIMMCHRRKVKQLERNVGGNQLQ